MPRPLPGQLEDSYHDMIDMSRLGSPSVDTMDNDLAVQNQPNMYVPFRFQLLQCQKDCHSFQDVDMKVLEGGGPPALHSFRGSLSPQPLRDASV